MDQPVIVRLHLTFASENGHKVTVLGFQMLFIDAMA